MRWRRLAPILLVCLVLAAPCGAVGSRHASPAHFESARPPAASPPPSTAAASSLAPPPPFDSALLKRLEQPPSSGPAGPAAPASNPPGRGAFLSPRFAASGDIPALLLIDGAVDDLPAMGFRVLAHGDGAAAVIGPPGAFRRLAAWPGLRFARLSRPVRAWLDRSLALIHADRIRHGPPDAYVGPTGRGVIVGIVDTGLDIFHDDFRRPDGTSRVLAFWDQVSSVNDGEMPVGQVFREEAIARMLRNGVPGFYDFDSDGHGTHVAGIAAGDGSAAGQGQAYRYVGVAPEADLVAVRTAFDEASVIAAVRFVFEEAARRGKPAVVNLSLGNQYGPHNGRDPFERLISDLCGPGRLVAVAAGNDGGIGIHAFLPGGSGADSVTFFLPQYQFSPDRGGAIDVEAWGSPDESAEFEVVMPRGRRLGPVRLGQAPTFRDAENTIDAGLDKTPYGRNFFVEMQLFGVPRAAGIWTVVARPQAGHDRGDIHFWIPYADLGTDDYPRFLRGRDERATLSPPANAENVVAVGATVSKLCWLPAGSADTLCFVGSGNAGDLADFSSLGPTADGRPKPEVAAPGFGIVSALSASMSQEARSAYEITRRLDPDGVHWIQGGTSMAAPHVVGALALLLERAPRLSPLEAQLRLAASGASLASPAGTVAGSGLDLALFVPPAASVSHFAGELLGNRRVRLSWLPAPPRGAPLFHLGRSYVAGGPYLRIPGADSRGEAPGDFVDGPLEPGRRAYYRLSVEDVAGFEEPLDSLAVTVEGTPALTLRYPAANPTRPPVQFSFYLPATASSEEYRFDLFDVQGRLVATLDQGRWSGEGREIRLTWDGRSSRGRAVAAGLYVARLSALGRALTTKVALVP